MWCLPPVADPSSYSWGRLFTVTSSVIFAVENPKFDSYRRPWHLCDCGHRLLQEHTWKCHRWLVYFLLLCVNLLTHTVLLIHDVNLTPVSIKVTLLPLLDLLFISFTFFPLPCLLSLWQFCPSTSLILGYINGRLNSWRVSESHFLRIYLGSHWFHVKAFNTLVYWLIFQGVVGEKKWTTTRAKGRWSLGTFWEPCSAWS